MLIGQILFKFKNNIKYINNFIHMNPSHNLDDDDGDNDDNYDPEAEVGFESKGPSVL